MRTRESFGRRFIDLTRELNTLLVAADASELGAAVPSLAATLAHATARLAEERELEQERAAAASTDPQRCLTMRAAARDYGILENTLREAGRVGDLPTVQIGRYVYVRAGTLERWLADHEKRRA